MGQISEEIFQLSSWTGRGGQCNRGAGHGSLRRPGGQRPGLAMSSPGTAGQRVAPAAPDAHIVMDDGAGALEHISLERTLLSNLTIYYSGQATAGG